MTNNLVIHIHQNTSASVLKKRALNQEKGHKVAKTIKMQIKHWKQQQPS